MKTLEADWGLWSGTWYGQHRRLDVDRHTTWSPDVDYDGYRGSPHFNLRTGELLWVLQYVDSNDPEEVKKLKRMKREHTISWMMNAIEEQEDVRIRSMMKQIVKLLEEQEDTVGAEDVYDVDEEWKERIKKKKSEADASIGELMSWPEEDREVVPFFLYGEKEAEAWLAARGFDVQWKG